MQKKKKHTSHIVLVLFRWNILGEYRKAEKRVRISFSWLLLSSAEKREKMGRDQKTSVKENKSLNINVSFIIKSIKPFTKEESLRMHNGCPLLAILLLNR